MNESQEQGYVGCVDPKDLRLFAAGRLRPDTRETIVLRHVLECEACQSRARLFLKSKRAETERRRRHRREVLRLRLSPQKERNVFRLRLKVSGEVRARRGNEPAVAFTTRDLSMDGVYLVCSGVFYPSDKVQLEFRWPHGSATASVRATGTVMRAEIIDPSTYGYGIRFDD